MESAPPVCDHEWTPDRRGSEEPYCRHCYLTRHSKLHARELEEESTRLRLALDEALAMRDAAGQRAATLQDRVAALEAKLYLSAAPATYPSNDL